MKVCVELLHRSAPVCVINVILHLLRKTHISVISGALLALCVTVCSKKSQN